MKTVSDYEQDGLKSIHNNEFMEDEKFLSAYNRGVRAVGTDYNWHWRVHIGLWAAKHCYHYEGDYIESACRFKERKANTTGPGTPN